MPYVCKVTSVTIWLVENSRLITSWTMKWKLGQRRHPLFESEVSVGPLSSYDDLTADLICLCRFHAPSSLFSINGAAAVCPWYHFHRLRLSCSAEDCTYSDSYHHTEPCHSCPFFSLDPFSSHKSHSFLALCPNGENLSALTKLRCRWWFIYLFLEINILWVICSTKWDRLWIILHSLDLCSNGEKTHSFRDLSRKFNMALGKMDIWHMNVYI